MKKVSVLKSTEIEVKPFVLFDFIPLKETHKTMKKITKKMLRELADDLGLNYNDKQIIFTKKLMTAHLER